MRFHDDPGNEFDRLWLDPTQTSTSAMFADPAERREVAQQRQMDFDLSAARPGGPGRILDVGCGWAPLLRRAVERHGAVHAVGVTVSETVAVVGPGHVARSERFLDFAAGDLRRGLHRTAEVRDAPRGMMRRGA